MVENINKTHNLISIITIVRNGVEEIEQTIKSVLNQKNVNLEYIIIDGESKDGTLDIIERYKERINILISEPDNGIYDAINKGIKLASGELIGLIHCGDSYKSDVLKLCYKKYLISKNDIFYGDINILDETDGVVFKRKAQANHRFLKKRMSIFHPATFVSKSCYSKNGLYNINYKIAADYDFMLRNFLAGSKFEYLPISLAIFRSGGASGDIIKSTSELFLIWKQHIGGLNAFKKTILRLVNYYFFYLRKKITMFIIGKSNYNKLKIKNHKKSD